MPDVQVTITTRGLGAQPEDVEVHMRLDLVPRGSGNRNFAAKLAEEFRTHEILGPHVRRASAGASRVLVVFDPTPAAMAAIWQWHRDSKAKMRDQRADAEQMRLAFG